MCVRVCMCECAFVHVCVCVCVCRQWGENKHSHTTHILATMIGSFVDGFKQHNVYF
jgi:hypothetical protein